MRAVLGREDLSDRALRIAQRGRDRMPAVEDRDAVRDRCPHRFWFCGKARLVLRRTRPDRLVARAARSGLLWIPMSLAHAPMSHARRRLANAPIRRAGSSVA